MPIRAQKGFTLLELLIAISLMAVLMVVLYGGLNTGMRSWQAGLDQTERVNEMRLVTGFLRTQLRQSMTVYRNDPDQGRVVFFEGDDTGLGWVAPMLSWLGLGGLYFVQLDWSDDDDGVLRLRWQPYRPGDAVTESLDEDATRETVLLVGVSDFAVEYYGSPEPGADPEWRELWENPAERPLLIRLSLAKAGRPWPTLTVALTN